MMLVPLDPVSFERMIVINARTERDAQKINGIPGLMLAKLLPRGGEAELPITIRVITIPVAVPE